jgi:hypothetical protein
MTSETLTTTRYTCDRCHHAETVEVPQHWAKLRFQTKTGGTISGRYTLDDICPSCAENFERWMNNRDA